MPQISKKNMDIEKTLLFWKKVQGLYYGDSGADDRVLLEPANSFDYMLMFEFYPKDLRHSGSSYKQKLKIIREINFAALS